ncbi:MAG: glycerol kinase GlpK [Anaerolineales bacterium]|nr:glycerol kinase GlpK [Anaerolineales bacterium]
MKKYVGAIDQGTTSTRFMIFDRDGAVVASAQKEHKQIYPKPGWVEHDALEIWRRTQSVMREALKSGGISAKEIVAVGATNQRETTVAWNPSTGEPICNALVWQDTRTDALCNALAKEGGQNRFRRKTGLPLATYFSGPKMRWILDNAAGAKAQAKKGKLIFGTIDSWLIWNLTGKHITDATNASRTMLMNLKTLHWDEEILRAMGVPRETLPTIKSSAEIYGEIQSGALKGVPLAGALGDQHAALFGQTCFQAGEAKNTYGTGCFLLMNTGEKIVQSKAGLLTTLAYQIGEQKAVYALEGSVAIAGALIQWLRDNLGLIEKSADAEALARTAKDNGGVYFVPAFSGLFAPYWKSDARGAIVGLTRYANKGHLARAALEATAYQTREALEAMEKDSGVKLRSLKADGGMVFNELLMQFQADILDVAVVRPKVAETTALGAAYAAGLAVGFWKDADELKKNWKRDKEWKPRMDEQRRAALYAAWKKAVTRTFDWIDS